MKPVCRKKLIEVALPLEAINKAAAHEKSVPRRGHPSTLHLWWARRPLAACRAILFASLVDDPGEYLPEDEAATERQRLFRLIEQMVDWDNIKNTKLIAQVRLEIARSVARELGVNVPVGETAICEFLAAKAPPVFDPFCGGGSISLEAQRFGLRAIASDLNPVAVLITKALIEISPKFVHKPPVHPPENGAQTKTAHSWQNSSGLAEDIRYYGTWMRNEAERRCGHLYPKVKLPEELGGEATVMAWLWARTIKCPNPVCGVMMPLVRTFWLSTKKGNKAWILPIVDPVTKTIHFQVKTNEDTPPDGTINRRGATCLGCNALVPFDYIRAEGKSKRINVKLMAIVAEGKRNRLYLSATPEQELIATQARPEDVPDTDLPEQALGFRVQRYGMTKHRDLFTPRQLVALTTLSDLVNEAREKVLKNANQAVGGSDNKRLSEGGTGTFAYADAVAVFLACAVDKLLDWSSANCSWNNSSQTVRNTFARQAIPMVWDFTEINPFSNSGGNFLNHVDRVAECISAGTVQEGLCFAWQHNVISSLEVSNFTSNAGVLISTDPPYYDNIGYADLSDFFYIWLRRSLIGIYPNLFTTLLTPKEGELVADPFKHGGRDKAQRFFENGLGEAFAQMYMKQHPSYPLTVYYAFKQNESETNVDENENHDIELGGSTGWETMLEALIRTGFILNGTWPIRTEMEHRMRGIGSNALSSSVVLVCRPRPHDSPIATRREFIAVLKRELSLALRQQQHGAIAPVDLAQAAIGPGMAVFSRYSKVLEADGSPMRVRTALALVNQALDEFLTEQEGEFDSDTRWALAWFEQFGHNEGPFGVAETLSKAKNTSIDGLVRAGVLQARAGKVHLLKREEFESNWSSESDGHQPALPSAPRSVWEATQYLIRALDSNGEEAAANLLRRLKSTGEVARDLAYRLYSICERKSWAQEALAYNMLATAWPRLMELAGRSDEGKQETLL